MTDRSMYIDAGPCKTFNNGAIDIVTVAVSASGVGPWNFSRSFNLDANAVSLIRLLARLITVSLVYGFPSQASWMQNMPMISSNSCTGDTCWALKASGLPLLIRERILSCEMQWIGMSAFLASSFTICPYSFQSYHSPNGLGPVHKVWWTPLVPHISISGVCV